MKEEQELFQRIGKLLWSIFPKDANKIVFKLQLFDEYRASELSIVYDDGRVQYFDHAPYDVIDEIFEVIVQLQKTNIFEKERFTHSTLSVSNEAKLSTQFAYIDEGDSWPGLYMIRVSELREEELSKHYIPKKEWNERKRLYGDRKRIS